MDESSAAHAHNRRFFGAVAVRVGSDVLCVALRVVLLGLVTRRLGRSEYGVFSQATTTATVLLPWFSLRLNAACVRFFPELAGDQRRLWRRFVATLWAIVAMGLLSTAVASLMPRPIAALIFDDAAHAHLVPLLFGCAFMNAGASHAVDFYRAVNETHKSSILNLVRATLTLTVMLAALSQRQSVEVALIASFCADAAAALGIIGIIGLRSLRASVKTLELSTWRALGPYFRYALPLVPYSLCVLVNAVGSRYFIAHQLGIEQAGVYALSYGLVSSAMLMSNAIAYVVFPALSQLWEHGETARAKELLLQAQSLSLYFSIPIGCALTALYPTLITSVASQGFVIDRAAIAAIAIGHVFLGLYGVNSFVVDLAKQSSLFLLVAGGALILSTALNVVLIPRLHLQGAACATLVTYLIQWLLMQWLARRLVGFGIWISWRFLASVLLGAVAMTVVVSLIDLADRTAQLAVATVLGACSYVAVTGLCAGREGRSKLLSLFSRRSPGWRT